MSDILKLAKIELIVIIAFIFFKVIRPVVLEHNPPKLIQVFLLSFPNFCEGVIGVFTLTMLGLYFTKKVSIKNETIYIVASILAAIYVITQELKIHNLGGENIFDPNDLVFSVIGLLVGFIIIKRIRPAIEPNSNMS